MAQDTTWIHHLYVEKQWRLLHQEIANYQKTYPTDTILHKKLTWYQYKSVDTINTYYYPQVREVLQLKLSPSPLQALKKPFLQTKQAELQNIALTYQKTPKKSTVLAGGLSAVVPGLGKVYAGKPLQMITPVLLITLTSLQAREIYKKTGVTQLKDMKNPLFWGLVGLGATFYLSDIYGSAMTARVHNQTLKKQYYEKIHHVMDAFVDEYTR